MFLFLEFRFMREISLFFFIFSVRFSLLDKHIIIIIEMSIYGIAELNFDR